MEIPENTEAFHFLLLEGIIYFEDASFFFFFFFYSFLAQNFLMSHFEVETTFNLKMGYDKK